MKQTYPLAKPANEQEVLHCMMATGLFGSFPDNEADFSDPDDQPIDIQGEPLSETIIRERC